MGWPFICAEVQPRVLIVLGTGSTAAAFLGFSLMHGSLVVYCLLWILYTIGYLLSDPIPYQIMVS
jgi:hypothetical protein